MTARIACMLHRQPLYQHHIFLYSRNDSMGTPADVPGCMVHMQEVKSCETGQGIIIVGLTLTAKKERLYVSYERDVACEVLGYYKVT